VARRSVWREATVDVRPPVSGVPVKKHLELIQTEKPNIIVGTPGRVKDLAGRPDGLDLSKVKFFILDECDKMLEGLGTQCVGD
jgi:superfamily II DNA/RNA helicase